MSFWSGDKLLAELEPRRIVHPFKRDQIDCAAYELTLGREIYVTPSAGEKRKRSRRNLSYREAFTIPPGQFAFLMSEERLLIPENVIAFISMKTRFKWRGLVNVSGFHVDPGFNGRLIFSVFNAGPGPIHLAQGERAFLIWFADLSEPSTKVRTAPPQLGIATDLINSLAGEVQSLPELDKQVSKVRWQQRSTLSLLIAAFIPLVLVVLGQCAGDRPKINDLDVRLRVVESRMQALPFEPTGSISPMPSRPSHGEDGGAGEK